MKPELAHLLICRTDNIGDVVLTLPVGLVLGRLAKRLEVRR